MLNLLNACGYTAFPKSSNKEQLLSLIAKYVVIDKPRSALEQFKDVWKLLEFCRRWRRILPNLKSCSASKQLNWQQLCCKNYSAQITVQLEVTTDRKKNWSWCTGETFCRNAKVLCTALNNVIYLNVLYRYLTLLSNRIIWTTNYT